jgi:mono/diheme cytochrome c family protein
MKIIFIPPLIAALAVIFLPTTLLTVAARSPYTHANLSAHFDPSYARTAQTEVGAPVLYRSPGLAVPLPANAPLEERGKALLVERGCAGCHGIDGQGSVVGPAIVPDIEIVRENVRKGPGGMPVFLPEQLGDDDLTAIVTFLKSVKK